MQVTHPEEENCAFFHTIDSNQNGTGTMFSLLPSAATHRQSIIQNLLSFLKWMLAPIAEPDQIAMITTQFKPKIVATQNHLLWDVDNNCVQQEENHMIGNVLQGYPIYNLTSQASQQLMVITTTLTWHLPASMGVPTQLLQTNQTDSDSLANFSLSQGTWFTTTTTQIKMLATWQEKLEKQTQEQFDTILSELSKMHKDMQNYTNPDNYGNYSDQDRAFSPNNMEEDKSTHYTKSLLYRAANNSHMEDIGTAKW